MKKRKRTVVKTKPGITRSTGEGKWAEETVLRQAELLRKTFDSMTDAIFVLDAKNPPTVLECNEAACRIFGYGKAEMLGKTTDFLHVSAGALREFQSQLYPAVEQGRLPFHLADYKMKRKDGSAFPSENLVSQLVDDKGVRTGWVSVVKDITESKRGEEALRRRAEELAALQATVLDITRQRDLPILLQAIVERASRLLNAPGGGLYLCDSAKQELRCVVSYNTPKNVTGTVLMYGEGAAGTVAKTGKPLVIDDYRTWAGRATVYEKDQPFSAVLSAPMTWQGQITGVIHVLDNKEARHFTQVDLELLTLFANHAAIAVENTRLLERLQRHSTELERLVDERTRKLQESENKYRQLVENALDGIWVIDAESKTTFVNQHMADMLGYAIDEMLGASLFRFMDEGSITIAKENLERRRRGVKEQLDFEFLRKDGRRIYTNLNTSPVADKNGNFVGAMAIVRDITERKRMEEELRATKERLEYVVTSNPAVIYTGRPLAGLSDWHLTYISDRVVTMLGFEPREFVGHPDFWESHVHPEDLLPCLAEIPRLWKEGQFTFEYRFLHKNGNHRWIREEANVVRDAAGNPTDVYGYWSDVTERKRLEERLLRVERLAAIGETAAMVGHDLRNPLQGIAGAAYVLKEQLGSTTDERTKEMLQLIEDDVEYSDKIINDLLDYSGPMQLNLAETSPKSITKDALLLTKVPRNITILDLTEEEPRLEVDVAKARRVFVNLIQNAIDAMRGGGELTIRSKRSNGKVEVTFTDTGAGMPEEVKENLWKPLQTTKAKGMGLGLAICKRIVEAHRGTISLESTVGKGTAFTVAMPIKPEVKEVNEA